MDMLQFWTALVLPIIGQENFNNKRIESAILAVKAMIKDDRSALSNLGRAYDIGMIASIWNLIANEIMENYADLIENALDEYSKVGEGQSINEDQLALRLYMAASVRCKPRFDALELVSIVMPSDLAERVLSGLEALEQGETREIFKATGRGRHHSPYSWDEARRRACEHVFFHVGIGKRKGASLKTVELKTSISVETLRSWERELKKDFKNALAFMVAHDAGVLAAKGSIPPSQFADETVMAAFKKLEGDALSEFGKNYKAHFGERHWMR